MLMYPKLIWLSYNIPYINLIIFLFDYLISEIFHEFNVFIWLNTEFDCVLIN